MMSTMRNALHSALGYWMAKVENGRPSRVVAESDPHMLLFLFRKISLENPTTTPFSLSYSFQLLRKLGDSRENRSHAKNRGHVTRHCAAERELRTRAQQRRRGERERERERERESEREGKKKERINEQREK